MQYGSTKSTYCIALLIFSNSLYNTIYLVTQLLELNVKEYCVVPRDDAVRFQFFCLFDIDFENMGSGTNGLPTVNKSVSYDIPPCLNVPF